MKKIAAKIVLICLGLLPNFVFAAGSVSVTGPELIWKGSDYSVYMLTYTWTADADTATVPSKIVRGINGVVQRVITNPGTPAPTDDYDITLLDEWGSDILSSQGADRDQANTEHITKLGIGVGDSLRLTVSGNAVNSATGTVYVMIAR